MPTTIKRKQVSRWKNSFKLKNANSENSCLSSFISQRRFSPFQIFYAGVVEQLKFSMNYNSFNKTKRNRMNGECWSAKRFGIEQNHYKPYKYLSRAQTATKHRIYHWELRNVYSNKLCLMEMEMEREKRDRNCAKQNQTKNLSSVIAFIFISNLFVLCVHTAT